MFFGITTYDIHFQVFWVVMPCSVVVDTKFQRSVLSFRQHGPLKSWYPITTLHSATAQKTSTFIVSNVQTSYLTTFNISCHIIYHIIPSREHDSRIVTQEFLVCGICGFITVVTRARRWSVS